MVSMKRSHAVQKPWLLWHYRMKILLPLRTLHRGKKNPTLNCLQLSFLTHKQVLVLSYAQSVKPILDALHICLYTVLCLAGWKSGTWPGTETQAAWGADIQQAYAEMWGKVSSLRKDGKWNQMPPVLRERRNQIWSFRWLDGSCSCSEAVGPNSALIKSLMLQEDKHDLLSITGMKQGKRRSHSNNCLSSSMSTMEFYWGGLRDVPWVNCPQIISPWQMPSSTARRLLCASAGALALDQTAAGRIHLKCQLNPPCPQGNWLNQPSKCSNIFFSLLLSSECT